MSHDLVVKIEIDGKKAKVECEMAWLEAVLMEINAKINTLMIREKKIMATLDEVKAMAAVTIEKVNVLNVALDGYREAVAVLKQQLADLTEGALLPPKVQAKVDEIATTINAATTAVEETMSENFPAEPPPPVDPPVEV
jgi:cell division protein FtsB